jgi:hypothetical protein
MGPGSRLVVEQRVAGSAVTYLHHGIDVGDGTVVHARPDDQRRPFGGGRVVRTSLAEFAGGAVVREVAEPEAAFPPAEIVARALRHRGRPGYCPVVDNCEHFTTWCATGRCQSRQVDIVMCRLHAAAARTSSVLAARMAAGGVFRSALRTAAGAGVRMGLRTLVPAALAAEAAALAVEWRLHQRGHSALASRRAGESAGLVTSAAVFAISGLPAGPAGMLAGALAGAAAWAAGSAASAVSGNLTARPAARPHAAH